MVLKKKSKRKSISKSKIISHPGNHHPSIPILLFVLVVGIVAALTIQYTNPSLLPFSASSSPTAKLQMANVSLIIDTPVVKNGDDVFAQIILDSPNQPVQAADFVLIFDPKVLSVTEIRTGTYFGKYPIKKIASGSIKLSGVALLKKTIPPPSGKGDVATIIFKTIAPTLRTTVAFDTMQTIVASNGKNILGVVTGASTTINPAE